MSVGDLKDSECVLTMTFGHWMSVEIRWQAYIYKVREGGYYAYVRDNDYLSGGKKELCVLPDEYPGGGVCETLSAAAVLVCAYVDLWEKGGYEGKG